MTSSYHERSSSKEKVNRSVDLKKLEGLYSDYKKQIAKRIELKDTLNKVIIVLD